ncbi:unnamed protein product [Allacma fusca]|uniref:Aldehyde dehydrogenase n=1 Tax=Allacma fusca TaxID=39272 RepID=A0A8J2PCU7_9HEXA|nr:unnamed protein product [Allacma fusca]
MLQVIGKAKVAFQIGKTLPISFRIEQLQGLINLLRENRGELLNALERDLRKPRTEGILSELEVVEKEARSMLSNLRKYTSVEKLPINLLTPTDRGYIRKEPYDRECYHVILGDVEETQELLHHKFDYIFFTGSPTIGKKVMTAAAPHLTPVTLELGGKNPCYIHDSADIQIATKRIIWGKFLNAGQACISIDYVICSPLVSEKFLRIAYQLLNEWHGTTARTCPNLSRIVSAKHFTRLSNLLDETKGRVILGGNVNQRELWIQPTVVIDVDATDPLMEDEIFGPILPIVTVSSVDEAITLIRSKSTPLALYTFSKDDRINEKIIGATTSGGVCINDVVVQATWSLLPFGGTGTSGMGAYHGKYSFDTFSHRRSVLHRGFSYLSEKSHEGRYPPYTLQKTKFLSLALKHFDKFFIAESKLYKFFLVFLSVSFYVGFRRVFNIPSIREILLVMKKVFLKKRGY